MERPHMRPRVDLYIAASPEVVLGEVRRRLSDPACPSQGTVGRRHLNLMVREEDRHTWSPCLDLEAREEGEGTRLRGRFGPHPWLWSLYMALYAFCAFVAVVAGCYGIAQVALAWTPTAFLGVIGAGLVALAAYGSSFVGQRLGDDQMHMLQHVVDGLCEVCPLRSCPRAVAAREAQARAEAQGGLDGLTAASV